MSGAKRVAVIGAGCSGLVAIKSCLEEDQIPVCLEKTLDIGGLWNYSHQPAAPNTAGIYESLVINTCKEMMAFSDFPVPEHFPQFLSHANVLRYFRMYADHFGLLPHIRFNSEVRHVSKADDYEKTGRWIVTYVTHVNESCPSKCVNSERDDVSKGSAIQNSRNNMPGRESTFPLQADKICELADDHQGLQQEAEVLGECLTCREVREEFDGVMICTGHHTVPYVPTLPGMQQFQGQILHSQSYKRPESFAGKTVLVIGIGNSAVDIASDLAKTAGKVYLSTRRGSWIVARTAMWGIPADMVANSRMMFNLPGRLLQWCVERQANLRMDHDKLGLTPRHRLLGAHPTINDEVPFHLMSGRIEVRPHVTRIFTRQVQFQDGTIQDVDVIIMATGYDYRLDFVDPEVVKVRENRVRLYKYVFPPHLPHPTLAVLGLVQAIGAVMPISELQSRWFLRLMLGHASLPDRQTMEDDVDRKQRDMDSKYYTSRRHTLQTFWIECMDEVAEKIGARPNLFRMFLNDPGLALRCYFGPCLPAQYRLQGPHPWAHAATFIKEVWVRWAQRSGAIRDPTKDRQQDLVSSGTGSRGSSQASLTSGLCSADGSEASVASAASSAVNRRVPRDSREKMLAVAGISNGASSPAASGSKAFVPPMSKEGLGCGWCRKWMLLDVYSLIVIVCVCLLLFKVLCDRSSVDI